MAVIAMTREMATRGSEVGAGLAERLGLSIIHHEIVEHEIAERIGVPESEVHRFLEGEASLLERWKFDRKRKEALLIVHENYDGCWPYGFNRGIVPMRFTVGLKYKGKVNHVVVDAEDALIAALKAKSEQPEAQIRPQNRRGDERHPPLARAKDAH